MIIRHLQTPKLCNLRFFIVQLETQLSTLFDALFSTQEQNTIYQMSAFSKFVIVQTQTINSANYIS